MTVFEQSGVLARQPAEQIQVHEELDHDDLLKQFQKLAEAAGRRKNATSLAEELEKRNWLSLLVGNISGRNQKDMAGMVEDLGSSLEVTQVALEVVMKLQMSKHRVLKEFHAALVNKIENITNDTVMLDGNQRGTTLHILNELNIHVEAQLEYHNRIEEHEEQFDQLKEHIRAKTVRDAARDEALDALQSRLIAAVENQLRLDAINGERNAALHSSISRILEVIDEQHDSVSVLQKTVHENTVHLAALDRRFIETSSVKAQIRRQFLAVAASLLSIAAIALTFRHGVH